VAAQWEIVDALEAQGTWAGELPFVVPPPAFAPSDILDVNRLVGFLRAPDTQAARELSRLIADKLREVGYGPGDGDAAKVFDLAGLNAARLAMYLNRLLPDQKMYQKFRPNVELHDLHRTGLGALGFEARQMPIGEGSLLRYQAQRVNRLIIEAVIPYEDVLKRGTYLSTDGVLDQVLEKFKDKLARIERVCVFGFPAHTPRCCRQTIESFWRAGRTEIGAHHVQDVRWADKEKWESLPWDGKTAQIWCRNLRNWLDYEAMALRRR
jgi:hypothetical protein